MMSLTTKQAELLAFIKSYMAEHDGLAPSYQEMAEQAGLGSKSNVHRALRCLEERGLIRRLHHRARALEVLEPTPPPLLPDISKRLTALTDDNLNIVASMVEAERQRRQMRAAA